MDFTHPLKQEKIQDDAKVERIEKTISKLDSIKQACYNAVAEEAYFLTEDTQKMLGDALFQRTIEKMQVNL